MKKTMMIVAILLIICLLLTACSQNSGKIAVGDIIKFGHYEQDNNTANGKEEIEWIVVEVQGNKAMLLSRYGLDAHRFDASKYQGWAKSEMRSWLNSTFLNNAFTDAEQQAIITTTVKTGNNDEWVTRAQKEGWLAESVNGGEDTQDKLFLLSLEEAMAYGGYKTLVSFASSINDKMKATPTKYAIAQGARHYNESDSYYMLNGTGCCWWWLRSPGSINLDVSLVSGDGRLRDYEVNDADGSIRPALWLNLDSADIHK